uniref:Solute carrier organic anion transporter family member n=1 Tax=Panagrolaimus sp. JU765 TaxID=591449 RepID=A0AC34QS82_9BILA
MPKLDATVKWFFVVFLTVYFLESIGGFYMTTAVVSIEKQFRIPSKTSGTMVSAGDFGYIPTVIFVAYLGGKGNRARWIGMGCILIAIANILISSSNFLFTDTPVNTTASENSKTVFDCLKFLNNETIARQNGSWCEETYTKLRPSLLTASFAFCNKEFNAEKANYVQKTCQNDQMTYFGPTFLIFAGLVILGVGRTMPFSLGLPLIDDNVKKQNLPVYFAGMFLIRLVGPVVGFGMGTYFNKYYYKFEQPPGLTQVDPDWIGRWWAGFLAIGLVLFFPSLALFLFPTPKPSADGKPGLVLVDKHVKRNSEGKAVIPDSISSKIKDFTSAISDVLKNPIYVGSMIGRIMDVFTFKGFFVFLPKYVEVQFGLPQYKINMFMGIIGVFGFAIGVLLGTVVMKLWKFEGRRAAGWVAACSAFAALLSFANAGVGCDSTLTTLGNDLTAKMDLNLPCMSNCGCDKMPMFPVCDVQGNVFYSPCHAGCPFTFNEIQLFSSTQKNGAGGVVFSNCRCSESGEVSRQFCLASDCEIKAYMYFFIMALGGMVGGMGVTPGVLIILRAVPPVHRSISLGFNGFLVSLLATLPSPIFWGFLIDRFCIKWDEKCADSKGSCSLYDAANLRVWLHVLYGVLRVVSLVTDVFVLYHAKNLRLVEDVPDEGIRLESLNKVEESLVAKSEKENGAYSDYDYEKKMSIASEMLQVEIPQQGVP